ncbi:MAG TPA: nitrite reductase small subunit NirD [Acidimicrobiales bacterium]|nr:nitrite reductase small subunit NirD [Acidimicrobiales bacterium]
MNAAPAGCADVRWADVRWADVCPLAVLEPDRGVAVMVGGRQVAVFRLSAPGSELRAVDHRDPVSGANVLARGLVGSAGTVVYVASPMHKQRYDLDTGRCLDDPTLAVDVWPVRVRDGRVEVGLR